MNPNPYYMKKIELEECFYLTCTKFSTTFFELTLVIVWNVMNLSFKELV